MKVVLLDGPDGSGKSTLADALIKEGYYNLHFGVPPAAALKNESAIFHFYLDQIYYAVKKHTLVVCDRSHLAEPIYGPVMRGGTKMTYRVEALLERYLEAIDAQIVICLPPYRTAFNNWLKRKGTEYVKEAGSYRKIYDGYAHLLFNRRRNRNFIWYDFTRHRVMSFMTALRITEGFPLPAGMVGSQRPRFLFVGDRVSAEGGKNDVTMDLPFMSPNNCSGWFFDKLKKAGYQEHEIAFANAYNHHGMLWDFSKHILGKIKGLSQIIALGQEAIAVLHTQGVPCIKFTHPQFAKRFQSKEVSAYVEALKDIRRRSK